MDRITQIQEAFDKIVIQMYTSIGVLKRDAPSSTFEHTPNTYITSSLPLRSHPNPNLTLQQQVDELAVDFSQTSKELDDMISSLATLNEDEFQTQLSLLQKEYIQVSSLLDGKMKELNEKLDLIQTTTTLMTQNKISSSNQNN